ncbi:unnamed protein product [Rodentolepis nana]|uniref:ATPase_AAA_core domain-containing protein n=1 Tax=Rodentolepis nana TaxID=102285 RepID=A0A0R3TC53_RODNA|nr:unnamed protein product [Rodentolepis nana]
MSVSSNGEAALGSRHVRPQLKQLSSITSISICYFIEGFVDRAKENRDMSLTWKKDLQIFSLLRLMLPSKLQTLLMAFILILTLTSEYLIGPVFTLPYIVIHITVGALALLVSATVILWEEKTTFMALSGTGLGQNCFVIPGATERFKLMGCEFIVNFHTVFSTTGSESQKCFSPSQWLSDHAYGNDIEQFGTDELVEVSSLSFSNNSNKIVYKVDIPLLLYCFIPKVSSKTKLKIIPVDGIPSSISLKNKSVSTSTSIPVGLESSWYSVVEFVRQYSLSLDFLPRSEPTGLLLYGLQGCGKSLVLETLSKGELLKHQAWYSRLHFCTLSVDGFSVSKSDANMNSFRKYITSKLADVPKSCYGVIVTIPNLDTWLTLVHNPDSPQSEDPHDQESTSRNSGLYSFLFSALNQACSTYPVCVLATSTESINILKHRDLRNLFYRRLLVSLPSGEQRFQLLKQEMELLLPTLSKFIDQSDNNRLSQVAASLHGYTQTDIFRLFRASYASAVDECFKRDLKPESGDLCLQPTVQQIIDKLENERTHYRPANLCAEISVFPPMRFADIGGYSEIKHLFTSTIQSRLTEASDPSSEAARINKSLGLTVPRGVLLHGPPGCSKTLFVRALATECNLPLVAVQASRIFGRYVGDSERNMQRILIHARACSPAILFIDEIDLLLPSRSTSESGVSEHVLGEVLTVMDGVEGQCGDLLLVAATNRLENLDPVCGFI